MHPVMRQSGFHQIALECPAYKPLIQMTAISMSEYQIREFSLIPEIAGFFLPGFLIGAMLFQHFHHERRGLDDPRFSVLQRSEVETASFLSNLAELLFHMDHTVLEIHAIPSQADQFSTPYREGVI